MTADTPFAKPLRGKRFAVEPGDTAGRLVIRRLGDGEAVGCAEWRLRDGTLHIESLAVEEGHRGFGAGSEAARLVIEAALERAERVTAWAPKHQGLAVYFWFRMGFRPVPGEGPDGGLLFERGRRGG